MQSSYLEKLESKLSNCEDLCVASSERSQEFLQLLRSLYNDFQESSDESFGPFHEIIIDGLDLESIWEELQTWNRPITRYAKKKLSRVLRIVKQSEEIDDEEDEEEAQGKWDEQDEEEEEKEEEEKEEEGDDEDDEDGEDFNEDDYKDDYNDFDDDNFQPSEALMKKKKAHDETEESEDNEEDGDNDQHFDVDDDEAEAYLDSLETMEFKSNRKKDKSLKSGHEGAVEDDEEDDEADDFAFAERELYNSDDDDDDQESNQAGNYKELKFSDFFGSIKKKKLTTKAMSRNNGRNVKLEEEDDDDDDAASETLENEFNDDDFDANDIYNEDGDEDDEDEKYDDGNSYSGSEAEDHVDDGPQSSKSIKPSNLSLKQLKLARETAEIESTLIGAKRWDMMGEIKGGDRPENSLLEAIVDVDRLSKPAPIITKEYTSTIEELIKLRIKEDRWDDVKALIIDPIKEKKSFELSQEKSALGLGQIYEDDFMGKTAQKNGNSSSKEDSVCKEIDILFDVVARQLDALSHFHFTPKPVVADITMKSIANVPSLTLEEVAPSILNLSSTAAPEEIKQKRTGRLGAFLTDADIGRDDKKRLRQASKVARKKAKMASGDVEGKKSNIIEELKKDRRVTAGVESTQGNMSKSGSFFSQMQTQAQVDASTKAEKRSNKKLKVHVNTNPGSSFKM